MLDNQTAVGSLQSFWILFYAILYDKDTETVQAERKVSPSTLEPDLGNANVGKRESEVKPQSGKAIDYEASQKGCLFFVPALQIGAAQKKTIEYAGELAEFKDSFLCCFVLLGYPDRTG